MGLGADAKVGVRPETGVGTTSKRRVVSGRGRCPLGWHQRSKAVVRPDMLRWRSGAKGVVLIVTKMPCQKGWMSIQRVEASILLTKTVFANIAKTWTCKQRCKAVDVWKRSKVDHVVKPSGQARIWDVCAQENTTTSRRNRAAPAQKGCVFTIW